jgi:LPXTG-motif cell wall-anchored protein
VNFKPLRQIKIEMRLETMIIGKIKRAYRLSLQVMCASLLSVALLPQLHADEWNKSTMFTFTDPVQIPGQVLPAGTYVFRLLNSLSDRHVVQVWDEKDQHLIATVIAINNYRLEPKGRTVMTFAERAGGQPDAIKQWFYPGDNFGQEFLNSRPASLTASVTRTEVPVTYTPITPAPAEAPAAEAAPAPAEPAAAPAEEAPQASQPEQQPAPPAASTPAPEEPAPASESLPKTGSELPLIGLLGFSSLGSGLMVRILRRR